MDVRVRVPRKPAGRAGRGSATAVHPLGSEPARASPQREREIDAPLRSSGRGDGGDRQEVGSVSDPRPPPWVHSPILSWQVLRPGEDPTSGGSQSGSGPENAAHEHPSLEHAVLEHAVLEHAVLEHAALENAALENAALENAVLENAALAALRRVLRRPGMAGDPMPRGWRSSPLSSAPPT